MDKPIIQINYNSDVRLFSNLAAFILIAWAASFLLSLGIGTLVFEHIPVYGKDGDPHSMDSPVLNMLQFVNLISLIFSFVAFIAWPFLLFHLLLNKQVFSRIERLLHVGALCSVIVFFLFRFVWTAQFLWLMD